MTDEEYQRAQQLVNEINALAAENARLEAELEAAEYNVQVLTGNVGVLESNVHQTVSRLSDTVQAESEDFTMYFNALQELSEQYFTFKNLSTASKNLTMYTDIYFTKFASFHKLRRIALGYVIGLDSAIISNEMLRLEVEKAYLQNTEYWLAYAIMAVMLWAQNQREAANRALNRALSMDYYRSSVFFLLINLRFERTNTAREWYLNYLEKVDMSRLGNEFQYLLQAYLNGLFGTDPAFEALATENFKRLLEQTEATTVNFGDKFTDHAQAYAATYLHRTEETFPTLKEVCRQHNLLMDLLSDAEKHTCIAQGYIELAEAPNDLAEEQAQRVENVLYDLINSYDDAEWQVVKEQKRAECVMDAKGDMKAAQENFDLLYAHMDERKSLADLMVTWAFSDDPTESSKTAKRFTIAMMKDRICRGYEKFAEIYRRNEPESCTMEIDGCQLVCRDDSLESQTRVLEDYYDKNKVKHLFADKQVKIYSFVCLAALLVLIFMVFSFSPIALTIGVLGGVIGGFLLWRRLVDVGLMLEERKRLAKEKLRQALEELNQWRRLYHEADSHLSDIQAALDRF